ncbi:MAG: peptide chain release factor N(5)-glutamine methyltransferase [Treponema sp.]|nr:peptide chain release factor N(5)-glutamine methyltransferase [Treponema sp.]
MNVAEIKQRMIQALSPTSPSPQLDAECILQWVLGCDKTHLLLRRSDVLSEEQLAACQDALEKRKTGFPIAYITGTKEFFGYEFYVTPSVLIPKPDTELLVEQAMSAIREKQAAHPQQILTVCDMCTGSGCVGISVLRALLDSGEYSAESAPKLTLADISEDALDVARKNVIRLLTPAQRDRVHFVRTNLFAEVPHSFDVIVTNPPYVPHTEAHALLQDGRSEPILALDGDVTENGDWSGTEDGLALIQRLVPQAYEHLSPHGVLLMETGEYNAEATAEIFARAGLKNVRIERDMAEQLRDVIGEK